MHPSEVPLLDLRRFLGRVFPDHSIGEKLREDADGTLFRGRRTGDDREVLFLTSVEEHPTAEWLARLEREHALRNDLELPWATRPLALARPEGRWVLLLEDPGGRPLDVSPSRRLPVAESLRVALGVAICLSRVHAKGLVHRDIKPAHLLTDPSTGAVALTGFGVACRSTRERQEPGPTEALAGTLAYMAPEQTGRMNRPVDARSDLYSLGVVLYQTLTGRLPFTAADPSELLHSHLARQAVPPAEVDPAIPVVLSHVVMKLLAKPPEARYQTALGVEADLRKCLDEWETEGRIAAFPLAEEDVPDRPPPLEKLYGREAELGTLRAAWERVASGGAPELVLVSGLAGVGKSSLVNVLRRDVAKAGGLFAAGKFDEQKKHIPYASLAQAFQNLIRQLLVEPEEEVARWQRVLEAAVQSNGRVLTDILPDLELLLGPQPEVSELAPLEAKNRFLMTFSQFVDAIATPEHPLVLFLDDLQWQDSATLELLMQLVSQPGRRSLLLLGAYRDNEVDAAHPLTKALDSLRAARVSVEDIVLGPLAVETLVALLSEMLQSPPERVEPLARLVWEKTEGNPFFTLEFVTALHEERLLWFAPDSGGWTYDLESIRTKGYTDNVVDLVAGRIHRLSADCQRTLQSLACLGIRAETELLLLVLRNTAPRAVARDVRVPDEGLHAPLREAERAGLLSTQGDSHTFVHDRVREAAYTSMAPPERSGEHVRLGRLLLAGRTVDEVGDQVFELVNQFNRGLDLVLDAGERGLVRRLNLRAGRKARAAVAYAAAREYLAQASALLPVDPWTTDYAEAFATALELAECEYLVGRFEEADSRFRDVAEKAGTDLDRAKVLRLRVRLYDSWGRYGDGLKTGIEALRLLGFAIPDAAEDIRKAVEAEQAEIPALLDGRRIADLALAEEASDPRVRASLDLIAETTGTAFLVKPELYPLLIFRGLTLSLKHGNTASSCLAYTAYGVLLAGFYRDIPSALAFSEMSLALNAHFRDASKKGALLFFHGGFISLWARPLPVCKAILEQGIEASLQAGTPIYALYASALAIWFDVEAAESIAVARSNCKKYRALADRIHNDVHSLMFRMCDQFFLCMEGLTFSPPSFEDGVFQEDASLEAFRKGGLETGLIYHHVLKLIAAFTFGKFAEGLEHADQAWELQGTRPPTMLHNATHVFFHALTLTALSREVSPGRQVEFAKKLSELLAQLAFWADQCPETFLSRHALVAAEISRLEGRDLEVSMKAYAQAIASARKNGFIFVESLACELAARFFLDRGFERIAYAHLRDARAGFLRWGAHEKVAQLDRVYPGIEKPAAPGATATFGASLGQLDLAKVVKASQAVSVEIEPSKLVETLMGLVMDHAGADRGLLLLPDGDGFRVEAEAALGRQGLAIRQPRMPLAPGQLADGVFRYVLRTRERVILEDASSQGLFTEDEYVKLQKAKSILGLPLLKQTRLLGVLYLENSLAPGVFTPSRITALEVLASQAAISLENARLFADLEQEKSRLQAVIQQVPAGLIIAEAPSGRFLVKNDRVDRMLRGFYYPSGSVEDYGKFAGFHPDGRRVAPEEWPLARSVRTGETVTEEEIEMRWADGAQVWLSLSSRPIRDSAGTITSGIVIFQDVTERKRREEALRASEERFSKAFKSNPTPMAVVRSKDRIFVDENERFLRLVGYTAEEIDGQCAAKLGTWFMNLLDEASKRLAAGGLFRDEEVTATAKSGESKALLASIEAMMLGGDSCYLATFVDLTERKQVEEQLRQSQKMEAIGSLAGGVAHDFNNLLTVISGHSELAMMGMAATSQEHEHLRAIRSSGERAASLTRQLLAFSRKEVTQTQVQSLNAIVTDTEDMLRRLIEENVEITTRLDPEAGSVNVDKGQVVQILMNLVVNARDAMPEGGRILVVTRRVRLDKPTRNTVLDQAPGSYVLLTVKDTGTGMTPEVKAKLFEPFFTTKAVGKGTGLGLAVVYGVMKQLGGCIALESEPGQGTTFHIYFPEVPEGTVAGLGAGAPAKSDAYRGSETVLVVEDDDLVRRFIKRALSAQGYTVLEARNGVEALCFLERAEQSLDLVVTDLMMPNMGGRALGAHVQAHRPALQVLYTSGYSKDIGDSQEALANADHFISKPFGPLDLARKVREILDHPRQ
jgi:PAS domain S-box-containing protein